MKLGNYLEWVKTPKISMFIAGLILVSISIISNYFLTLYNSDDVVIQTAMLHWVPFSGDIFVGNKDVGFILQAPIYWLVSLFIEPGRPALLASGLILALINFTLVYIASLYFLRVFKVKITHLTLLPIVWLSTFGFELSRIYLGTNLHNLVVGLVFVFLMIISKMLRHEFKFKNKLITGIAILGLILFIGLSIVNDRYFLYFGIVPAVGMIALYGVQKLVSLKKISIILGIILAGYIATIPIRLFMRSAGVILLHGVGNPEFVTFADFGSYLANTLSSFLSIMGANFFGESPVSIIGLSTVINLLIVFVVIYASVKFFKGKSPQKEPELFILTALFWFVILAYAFSSFNLGIPDTYRYFVMLPFLAPLILIVFASRNLKKKAHVLLFGGIFVLAIVLNIAASATLADSNKNRWGEGPQVQNYQLIDTLKQEGLTKGYSEFWQGNINTYLSGGAVNINPIICFPRSGAFSYPWFINRTVYLTESDRSFFLFNTMKQPCEESHIEKQFGIPKKIVKVGEYTIWVYDYDLVTKLDAEQSFNINKLETSR